VIQGRVTSRRWLALAGLLFVSYAWFYQAGGWNQNSRFDLIRAIAERGTLRIDAYHRNTGDKAVFRGHMYSDKPPGQAFLAAPFVAAAHPVVKSPTGMSYLATLVTAAVPAAAAALLVVWLAIRLGASTGGGLFAGLVYGLGTPAFAYATLLWGHALVAFGLVAAFACAVAVDVAGPRRRDWLLGLGLGAAAGWATATEYQAAPMAVLLAGFALARARSADDPRRLLRVAGGIAAGALPCMVLLGWYDTAAFGSPLATPLTHLAGFAQVRNSPFHFPSGAALVAILFGLKRGLLPLAPVLLAAPVGYVLGLRPRGGRGPWIVAAVIVGYYLLLNAAFRTPMAGWSYGPRYIAAAMPFLALGVAPVWTRARRAWRVALGAAAAVGVALALMAVSTTPQPPEELARPVTQLIVPAFADGDLMLNHQSVLEVGADAHRLRGGQIPHDAWNVGEKLGLHGWASLAPLLAGWLLAGWLLLGAAARGRDDQR